MHVEILSKLAKSGQPVGLAELFNLLSVSAKFLFPGVPVVVSPARPEDVLPRTLLWGVLFGGGAGPHGWRLVKGAPAYVLWYCDETQCSPALVVWHVERGGQYFTTWDWVRELEGIEPNFSCTVWEMLDDVLGKRSPPMLVPYKLYGPIKMGRNGTYMEAVVEAPPYGKISTLVIFLAVWGDNMGILPQSLHKPYLPMSWPRQCPSYMYSERLFIPPAEDIRRRGEADGGGGEEGGAENVVEEEEDGGGEEERGGEQEHGVEEQAAEKRIDAEEDGD